jgi:hypothetical protein
MILLCGAQAAPAAMAWRLEDLPQLRLATAEARERNSTLTAQLQTAVLEHRQHRAAFDRDRDQLQVGDESQLRATSGPNHETRSPNVESIVGCQSVRQWLSFLSLRTVVRG